MLRLTEIDRAFHFLVRQLLVRLTDVVVELQGSVHVIEEGLSRCVECYLRTPVALAHVEVVVTSLLEYDEKGGYIS
jgi:hypothetical protein